MGSVYRARDLVTDQTVALKLMNADQWSLSHRFTREAMILSDLHHPGIVRYVGSGATASGVPYLAMEWLDGEDLGRVLARRGSFNVGDALELLTQAAEALKLAHAHGIVHRDIKPSNLFLVAGKIDRLKVLDFGIARFTEPMHPATATATGTIIGTPGYMAPEQARGDDVVGASADVFSLGCVFYECLAGHPAFAGQHLMAVLAKVLLAPTPRVRRLRPEVSSAMDELLARMLAKLPELRPTDAGALLVELAHAREAASDGERISNAPQILTTREQSLLCVLMIPGEEIRTPRSAATLTGGAPDVVGKLRGIAGRHGGKVEVLNDGTLVIAFEPTTAATDLASQAARCALALRALLPQQPMALATGSGIVAGRLPIGEVIDRAVSLLSPPVETRTAQPRAESAKTPAIVLDRVTAQLLEAQFKVQMAPSGEGELIGVLEQRDERRKLLGKPTPCVGRDRELATLEALFHECTIERTPHAMLITAPAGYGKSRLRHELVKRLESRGHPVAVWYAWGDPMRAGSPFGLLSQAIRAAIGLADGEPIAFARDKIRARASACLPVGERDRVAEFLGEIVGVRFPDEQSVQLRAARRDARIMADQIARAWEDWLSAECSRTPVAFMLEDLHWGDLPTVKLIESALRNLPEAPFFVLALARPEISETFPDLWKSRLVERSVLRPLSKRGCEILVRSVLGETCGDEAVERIVHRSEGNAFYLEELIRAEAQGGPDEVSPTVLAMVQARFGKLPNDARRVLRAASIFGQAFWTGGVEALLGEHGAAGLSEHLDALQEREWIRAARAPRRDAAAEHTFRHAILREAAYATLTMEDRALGHRLAAEWLEHAGERNAIALAEHYLRGEDLERAALSFHRAAEQALEANDFAAAIAREDRAIECGATGVALGKVRLVQAEAHNWRDEYEKGAQCGIEAMDSFIAHLDDAEQYDHWAHAAHQVIWASSILTRFDEVDRLAALLIEQAPSTPSPRLVMALSMAASHQIFGKGAIAGQRILQWLETHASIAIERDPIASAQVKNAFAARALASRNFAAAVRCFESALDDFVRAGSHRLEFLTYCNLGTARLGLGDFEQAESILLRAGPLARRLGIRNNLARINLSLIAAFLGRLEAADESFAKLISEATIQGERRFAGAARVYRARVLTMRSAYEDAIEEARIAEAMLEENPATRAYALAVRASATLGRNLASDALELAQTAMQIVEEAGGVDDGDAFIRLTHAEALRAAGQDVAARSAIRAAHDFLTTSAMQIDDEKLRHSFLTRVPENARTVELAREWGVE